MRKTMTETKTNDRGKDNEKDNDRQRETKTNYCNSFLCIYAYKEQIDQDNYWILYYTIQLLHIQTHIL